jgi:hypothetical protein
MVVPLPEEGEILPQFAREKKNYLSFDLCEDVPSVNRTLIELNYEKTILNINLQ